MAIHGKGRGIKASDEYTAALCYPCHHEIDAGNKLTQEERQALWLAAYKRTWKVLIALNMVVVDAPVPELDNC